MISFTARPTLAVVAILTTAVVSYAVGYAAGHGQQAFADQERIEQAKAEQLRADTPLMVAEVTDHDVTALQSCARRFVSGYPVPEMSDPDIIMVAQLYSGGKMIRFRWTIGTAPPKTLTAEQDFDESGAAAPQCRALQVFLIK